ncbi:MAG: hypothetical protein ACM3KE_12640 [Hyphomicrobiales bacterium]
MGVIYFFHPNHAAGQGAVLRTSAASIAGSGDETSLGTREPIPSSSPRDPLRLIFIGLGLLFVATFWRHKFKGDHQNGRGALLRPARTPAKPVPGLKECVWIDIPAPDPQPSVELPQWFDSLDPCIAYAVRVTPPDGGMADSDQAVRCRAHLEAVSRMHPAPGSHTDGGMARL